MMKVGDKVRIAIDGVIRESTDPKYFSAQQHKIMFEDHNRNEIGPVSYGPRQIWMHEAELEGGCLISGDWRDMAADALRTDGRIGDCLRLLVEHEPEMMACAMRDAGKRLGLIQRIIPASRSGHYVRQQVVIEIAKLPALDISVTTGGDLPKGIEIHVVQTKDIASGGDTKLDQERTNKIREQSARIDELYDQLTTLRMSIARAIETAEVAARSSISDRTALVAAATIRDILDGRQA